MKMIIRGKKSSTLFHSSVCKFLCSLTKKREKEIVNSVQFDEKREKEIVLFFMGAKFVSYSKTCADKHSLK